MTYLITGGCGFLGSNIACAVLEQGEKLVVFDNLSRIGSEQNLAWLRALGNFTFVKGDTRHAEDIATLVREVQPDVIFHFAGQVAMTTSIEDPLSDFQINAMGTLNVLEAVRKHSPDTTVIYSSTNKVYGDLEHVTFEEKTKRYEAVDFPNGFDEEIGLSFASPYGCSKGAADQYMLDYHRVYGIKTAVMRHSSMYGSRQFSSKDQGWIGWFCSEAIRSKKDPEKTPFTISGNGKQVRDVLHAEDMVRLYLSATTHIEKIQGEAFNIGGGVQNSLSLLELFDMLEDLLETTLSYTQLPPRQSDQKVFIADNTKIADAIGWKPIVTKEDGIKKMIDWTADMHEHNNV